MTRLSRTTQLGSPLAAFIVALAILMLASSVRGAQVSASKRPSSDMASVPGGPFRSVLASSSVKTATVVRPFRIDRVPVTNAAYLQFVRQHPQWQRGAAPSLFVDAQYLKAWNGPLQPGPAVLPDQPVASVSWFAARAYCAERGGRLPTWIEWELAAAADEQRADARATTGWQQQILNWYSRPSSTPLAPVGTRPANVYGVQDLHGLIWEWVEDFNALMTSSDARKAGDGDVIEFCGASALTLDNREEYAIAMRIALLSSLQGRDTTGNLGFRCVTP